MRALSPTLFLLFVGLYFFPARSGAEQIELSRGVSFALPAGWAIMSEEQLEFINVLNKALLAKANGTPETEPPVRVLFQAMNISGATPAEAVLVTVYAKNYSLMGKPLLDLFFLDEAGLRKETAEYVDVYRGLLEMVSVEIKEMRPMRYVSIAGRNALFIGYLRTDPVSGKLAEDVQYNFLLGDEILQIAFSHPQGQSAAIAAIAASLAIAAP